MQRLQMSILGTVLAVCGCAAEPPRHAVTISTDPAGAACTVTSKGEPITDLPSTPGVVRLPQSPRDVRVFCTSVGYTPTAAVLPAEADPGQLGLLFVAGGLGGLAGGAMSGAAYRYPPALKVTLPAMQFPTAQERDRFFVERAAESRRYFDQPIQAHRSMCRPDEFGCQHMIAEMERARDAELARLDKLREATQ